MKALYMHIRPQRLRDGFAIYEFTYYDERIPGPAWRDARKQRKRLWPPTKLPNGRAKIFPTSQAAWNAYTGAKRLGYLT